jgi:hypothetical protein
VWDLANGCEVRRLWHPAGVRPAALHPDGRYVVTGCLDGYVRLGDMETGEEVRRLVKHGGRIWGVALAPDGKTALSASDDGILRLSDIEKGGERRNFEPHGSPDWGVAISPDGRRLLTGAENGILRLGDLGRSDPLETLAEGPRWPMAVAFAPDGKHAASSADGRFIYWDLATKKGINVPVGQPGLICLAFTPDGRRIYFCSEFRHTSGGFEDRGVIGYWDTDGLGPPIILDREHGHLGLAILPEDGLVTTDLGGVARIWRPSRTIDRARKLEAAGRRDEAAAEYARAIADRPDDARLLIERGRLLFEMGRTSEAEADYARAARLAPDNPHIFLETAGWWVAGPYPPDLDIPASFRDDKAVDPSRPAPPAGNEERRWRRAPLERQGQVDLRKVCNADDVAAYALAVFDCATDASRGSPTGSTWYASRPAGTPSSPRCSTGSRTTALIWCSADRPSITRASSRASAGGMRRSPAISRRSPATRARAIPASIGRVGGPWRNPAV